MPSLSPRHTALILIDLQQGILSMPLAPRSGADVLAQARQTAARFRAAGSLVFPVRVSWAADFADALNQPVDQPLPRPAGGMPPDWDQLADQLLAPGDIPILKRQWNAFYGTELDLQLRRRGIDTLVLGGIATNFGVESTARSAWERNYRVIFAEDLLSSVSAEHHRFAIEKIFPRIGQVSSSDRLSLMPQLTGGE